MRRHALTFALALSAGCSSNTTSSVQSDAAVTGDTGPVAPTGLPGDDYCRVAASPACTGRNVNTCGVCVSPPSDPLARTNCDDTQRREYCRTGDSGQPNLTCFQSGSFPTAGASQRVTVWGTVKVFGTGGDSQHIRVTIYRAGADGSLGEMLGSAVSDLTHAAHGAEEVYSPSRDRVLFTRQLGGYQIANIPTETELIVTTEGDTADTGAQGLWSHRVYDYNILFANAEVDREMAPASVPGDHKLRYNPRAISNTDWTAIPSTSGLSSGITPGRGALAGEVHDCDDVRLSNAVVESAPRRAWDGPVVYFSENDTNPLPDLSRVQRGTSILGTYALLDLDAGPVTVAAAGLDAQRHLLHLGSYRARIFADSITVVTFRGLRPWQVPMQH